MKKFKSIALCMGILISFSALSFPSLAAEYITFTDYSESFIPDGSDGKMEVNASGEAGEDGYLYLNKSIKEMIPETVSGENLNGSELEEYTKGNVSYYRIKVADNTAPAEVHAVFHCPGFYDFTKKAETNGAEAYSVNYKFTNQLKSKIESYHVQIAVPEGNEIISVTKPSAYADYELSLTEGMRTVGLTKAAAPSSSIELAFTYNRPFVSTAVGKGVVWVLCLGIGLFVLIERYKKAKEDTAK